MFRIPRFALLASAIIGLSSSSIQAQTTYDVRPASCIRYSVIGTGHFTISSMKIPALLTSAGSYDGFVDRAMTNLVMTYANSDTRGTYQDAAKDITGSTGIAADLQLAMIWFGFSEVVTMLQEQNNAYNTYTFYCPANATYQISVHLTGGLDKPRNRVIISGPEGQNQIDDDNPSSSTDKVYYPVKLSRGVHTLTVALGSGSSAVFHNAGTLNWIQMNNPSPVSWTDPVVVAQASSRVYYDMPSVGININKTFVSNIPADHDFTNIINGSAKVDSFHSTGSTTGTIDFKASVNVKNCLGNTMEIPAKFLNAHATYEPLPRFIQDGNSISLFLSSTRLPDTLDNGTYENCAQ